MEIEPTIQNEEQGNKSKSNYALPVSIVFASLLISGTLFYTTSSSLPAKITDPNEEPTVVEGMTIQDNDHVLGSPDAKVTIFEYSDFQCPFCRSFYNSAYQSIKSKYVDTGEVKLVFRHLPLSFHPAAAISASAVECASEQGQFWEMHDKIFDAQTPHGGGTVQYGIDDLVTWADEIGLDADLIKSCIESEKYTGKIAANSNEATQFGLNGTPSFIVNNKVVIGALPFSAFSEVIENEL
jgi:protein-disulfide isomerase